MFTWGYKKLVDNLKVWWISINLIEKGFFVTVEIKFLVIGRIMDPLSNLAYIKRKSLIS